jgi:hypothetical protein
MHLSDIFLGMGREPVEQLMRQISIGRLKTYQLFDRMKTRLHLIKLNSETLRKSAPRVWTRLEERDEDFASELAQAILISHLDMIKAVLDSLKIPHEDGFFSKDADLSANLAEGWQQRVWNEFRAAYPRPALLFYFNHLGWEVANAQEVFAPPAEA